MLEAQENLRSINEARRENDVDGTNKEGWRVAIHRLFQLPIEHEGKEAGYWALPKAAQKVVKSTLRSLKVLIIDLVLMVSSLNLVPHQSAKKLTALDKTPLYCLLGNEKL